MNFTADTAKAASALKNTALGYLVANELYKETMIDSQAMVDAQLAALGTTEDELTDSDDDDDFEKLVEMQVQAAKDSGLVDARTARALARDAFCARWADVLVASGAHDREEADHLATRLPRNQSFFARALDTATRYAG